MQALREAEAIAWMFPSIRARGPEVDAFAGEAASKYPTGDVPQTVVEKGLRLMPQDECERVVELWAGRYADRWAGLTRALGDTAAAERALVAGALRAVIAERQVTPRDVVEPLDRALRRSPLAALSAVLPPQFVWSVDEARVAQLASETRRGRKRMDVVEQIAYTAMTFLHVRRTSNLVARLSDELPFPGLARASETLSEACGQVERSLDAARAATAGLLIAYVEQRRSILTSLFRTDVR